MKLQNRYILGINPCIKGMNYHDPSVTLVKNGVVVYAIEEERLNRMRHSVGRFPIRGVQECKKIVSVDRGVITDIAVSYQPQLWKGRVISESQRAIYASDILGQICSVDKVVASMTNLKNLIMELNAIQNKCAYYDNIDALKMEIAMLCAIPNAKVHFFEHHFTHAVSALKPACFSDAICIVADGIGEYVSTSIWQMNSEGIKKISEIGMPNSLGYLYAAATAYAGFTPWGEEGKLMALAPYGKSNDKINEQLRSIISKNQNNYDVTGFITHCLCNGLALDTVMSNKIMEEVFGHSPRLATDSIDNFFLDFAYEIQAFLERVLCNIAEYWMRKCNVYNLCLAGGIFMNCKANRVVRENTSCHKLYIQPVAGDAGSSLGAALALCDTVSPIYHLGLGNLISDDDIYKLDKITQYIKSLDFYIDEPPDLTEIVARKLAQNKIVCWIQNGCEFGSRALGFRSILASPNSRKISNFINAEIKHRELWRPFACSILEEYAPEILENYAGKTSPLFMIEAFKVKKEWCSRVSGVLHPADNTTRPQIVSKNVMPEYYDLIRKFYTFTGLPLVLNTSFNDKGQPLISDIKDAVNFFACVPVDILVVGEHIISKQPLKEL